VRGARERGAIVVVVAHRPIGIEAVDMLLVLKDGRMQAFGRRKPCWAVLQQRVAPPSPIKIVSEEESPNHERSKMRTAKASIRLHLIIGLAVIVVLAGGLGGWAATAQISGALIAPGQIVVDTNVKKVQHPTGGVVGEVRVPMALRSRPATWWCGSTTRHQGEPRDRHQESQRAVGAGGAAGSRTAGPRQDHIPPMLLDRAGDPTSRTSWPAKASCSRCAHRTRRTEVQLRERVAQLNEEIAGLTAQEKPRKRKSR